MPSLASQMTLLAIRLHKHTHKHTPGHEASHSLKREVPLTLSYSAEEIQFNPILVSWCWTQHSCGFSQAPSPKSHPMEPPQTKQKLQPDLTKQLNLNHPLHFVHPSFPESKAFTTERIRNQWGIRCQPETLPRVSTRVFNYGLPIVQFNSLLMLKHP